MNEYHVIVWKKTDVEEGCHICDDKSTIPMFEKMLLTFNKDYQILVGTVKAFNIDDATARVNRGHWNSDIVHG